MNYLKIGKMMAFVNMNLIGVNQKEMNCHGKSFI